MDLMDRRKELIAEHLNMEKVPESPWSPKHPLMKAAIEGGAKPLSDRPIAFLCDDEIVIVGDCIDKVRDGLKKFLEKVAADKRAWDQRRQSSTVVNSAILKAEQATTRPRPHDAWRIPQQLWNNYLFGLNAIGIDVILTDGQ